jgi:hypothetical protein
MLEGISYYSLSFFRTVYQLNAVIFVRCNFDANHVLSDQEQTVKNSYHKM